MFIALMLLFFHLFASCSQKYAPWPFGGPGNQPTRQGNNSPTNYYNPSDRGFTPVDNNGNLLTIPDRQVIFPGGNNNNPSPGIKRPPSTEEKNPSIVAQLDLISESAFWEKLRDYKGRLSYFTYNNRFFQWRKDNTHRPALTFRTLEDAIFAAQKAGNREGFFAIWLDNPNILLLDSSFYTSGRPEARPDNAPSNIFTLLVLVINAPHHIILALKIALANSRLRDVREGCYAIIAHFNNQAALELSTKEQRTFDFETELLSQAVSYCTLENISDINQILKEPGDSDYLDKLRAQANAVKDPPGSSPDNQTLFRFKNIGPKDILFILLQIHSMRLATESLQNIWKTKTLPHFPQTRFEQAKFFTMIFGAGLFLKNLAYQTYQFISKHRHKKGNI